MTLRIDSFALVGTNREIVFEPGLNIIQGPITTGKSTLVRLLKILLGGHVENLPPEVQQHVAAVAGRLRIQARRVAVTRRLVSTPTAAVEIAGDDTALRLPAHQPTRTELMTYGAWLLNELGLPRLEVSISRRSPSEGATSPVSIGDYFLYCFIPQDEIDAMVFGHRDFYRNAKRKYVFEILYGLYDTETARLEEELRAIDSDLRSVRSGLLEYERLLEGTPWENRTQLQRELQDAEAELVVLDAFMLQMRDQARQQIPLSRRLQDAIQHIDSTYAEYTRAFSHESSSRDQMSELARQLEAQLSRLTRSIVAGELLVDFDFQMCPRCGAPISREKDVEGTCYLCLQEPQPRFSRDALIAEQDRVARQLEETQELIRSRQTRAVELEEQLRLLQSERKTLASDLDKETQAYVSDAAESIAEHSRRQGELKAMIRQFKDYLELYRRMDAATRSAATLEQKRRETAARLDATMGRRVSSENLISSLESTFARFVEEFETPRFPGDPRAAIDRETYLPILNGRRFDQLSSAGLKVLTNTAYVLAHHVNARESSLRLPGLLVMDGLTKNVGRDEYDWSRVLDVFSTLEAVAARYAEDLQIIIAANDIPEAMKRYVRLELSESDRLIPV